MAEMQVDNMKVEEGVASNGSYVNNYVFSKLFEIIKDMKKRITEEFPSCESGAKNTLLIQTNDVEGHLEYLKSDLSFKQQLLMNAQQLADNLTSEIKKMKDSCKCNAVQKIAEIQETIEVNDEDAADTENDEDIDVEVKTTSPRKRRKPLEIKSEPNLNQKTKRARKPRIFEDMVYRDMSEESEEEALCTNAKPKTEPKDSDSSSSSKALSFTRRLPGNSSNILKEWIFQHWYHPYPSDEEKQSLAVQTGLNLNQLNNWFTNARRRLLKRVLSTQPAMLETQYPKPESSVLITYQTAHYPHSMIVPTNAKSPNTSASPSQEELSPSIKKSRNQKSPTKDIPNIETISITPIDTKTLETISEIPSIPRT